MNIWLKLEDIFKGQVEDELVGLMRMIVEKDHYNEIESVFTYFMEQVKEYKNIGTAYVTSAMELSDAQKAAVEKRLLETTKYVKFEMHYDVDAALIGGMVIRIKDRVVEIVKTAFNDLQTNCGEEELQKAKEYNAKSLAEGLRLNGYWAQAMCVYELTGVNMLENAQSIIDSITKADVNAYMKALMKQGNFQIYILDPEK